MLFNVASVLAVLSIAFWYLFHWEVFFNSDFAMIGLIGERILKTGEIYLYVPQAGYQGLLIEGYLSAILFKLLGATPRTLHLTATLMFFLFVYAFYFAVKAWSDSQRAKLATLFLCCASPLFFANCLRTQPNYSETFAIGCFLFWCFKKWLDLRKDRFFFLACFSAGFGFYLYGQIIYFFLAILISFLWMKTKLPKINWLVFFAVIVSVIPTVNLFGVPIPGPSIGVLCVCIWILKEVENQKRQISAFLKEERKRLAMGFILFLIGYSPNLYHRFVLRRFAKSGIKLIKFSEEFWSNARILVENAKDFLVGSEFSFLSVSLSIFGIMIAWALLLREARAREKNAPLNPFLVLGPLIFLAFLSSRSVNEPFSLRYILAFHLVLAFSLSEVLIRLFHTQRKVAVFLGLLWICVGAYSNGRAPTLWKRIDRYPQLTRWEDVRELVEFAKERNIKLGYSDYWPAYLINFVTEGNLILEPTYTDYLPFYEDLVKEEEKIVLIKAKTRLAAGPSVDEGVERVDINQLSYRILEQQEFDQWKVWVLEKVNPT